MLRTIIAEDVVARPVLLTSECTTVEWKADHLTTVQRWEGT
jgi:hypothetical protein